MKYCTTFSQLDWDEALSKVWKLARNFEEILNFGLEHNFITSSDIIHASDVYKDPNKEWDDDEVKEIMRSRGLRDSVNLLQDEFGLDDVVDELGEDDVLDVIGPDKMLEALENTWELDAHDESVKEDYKDELLNDVMDEIEQNEDNLERQILNYEGDDLHKLICDIVGCGYYDNSVLDKLKDKLRKNTYGITY